MPVPFRFHGNHIFSGKESQNKEKPGSELTKMRKLLISLLLFILIFPGAVSATQSHPKKATIIIKSSPDAEFQTRLRIYKEKWAQAIRTSRHSDTPRPVPFSDMYLAFGERKWVIGRKGYLIEADTGKQLLLPEKMEKQLLNYASLLRRKHYGELVPWSKADKLLPRKAKFTVVDLETGQSFKVQRRAGEAHADVQPLTEQDTKIMKDIYNGHWSWRRRAILVKTDGRTIAASMHGMPHGAGALQNEFPGHFCIHFWQSQTHRSEKMDPAHEMMIYKASGKLYNYLEEATPYELVDAFLVALNQHNEQWLKMMLDEGNPKETKRLLEMLKDAEAINNTSSLKAEDAITLVGVEIPVDVRIFWRGRGETKETLTFIVTRNAPGERWRIDVSSLLESLN